MSRTTFEGPLMECELLSVDANAGCNPATYKDSCPQEVSSSYDIVHISLLRYTNSPLRETSWPLLTVST